MRLKTYLYCTECKDETIHEWIGVWKGLWVFECSKCENRQFLDPDMTIIDWISEGEVVEE